MKKLTQSYQLYCQFEVRSAEQPLAARKINLFVLKEPIKLKATSGVLMK